MVSHVEHELVGLRDAWVLDEIDFRGEMVLPSAKFEAARCVSNQSSSAKAM
jgi:hypothetical protein